MGAVQEAVYALTDSGVLVLSPADPRVVDQFGDFLFVASDRVRSIRLVQSRHLAAIKASDFLWLVAPDGYVGQSAAMEIGCAVASGIPVYSSEVLLDLTLRQYVTAVSQPADALRAVLDYGRADRSAAHPNVLVDPEGALASAHEDLESIAHSLRQAGEPLTTPTEAAARRLFTRVVGPLRSR
jgi:hypothetical protein